MRNREPFRLTPFAQCSLPVGLAMSEPAVRRRRSAGESNGGEAGIRIRLANISDGVDFWQNSTSVKQLSEYQLTAQILLRPLNSAQVVAIAWQLSQLIRRTNPTPVRA